MRSHANRVAASLYGFNTGMIASTPAIAAIGFSRRSVSGPITPMITRDAPRLTCASSPNSRTRVTIRWICSSVAFGCVMTIIFLAAGSSECRDQKFSASPDTRPRKTRCSSLSIGSSCGMETTAERCVVASPFARERGRVRVYSSQARVRAQPLTSVLSPRFRGEAEKGPRGKVSCELNTLEVNCSGILQALTRINEHDSK